MSEKNSRSEIFFHDLFHKHTNILKTNTLKQFLNVNRKKKKKTYFAEHTQLN